MGLGGHLTWTAVARDIHLTTGLRCIPLELHNGLIKPIVSEMFINNPHIWQPGQECENLYPLQLNAPNANYCKQDTPIKAVHRQDCHIIDQIAEAFNVNRTKLKCELFFTHDEELEIAHELQELPTNFIAIEPESHYKYTVNRTYPFEKWQSVIDECSELKFVQVGLGRNKLKNCIDATSTSSFRIACGLIRSADLFVSSEGGLVHGATAVNTRSLVIMTGYQSEKMVCYPQNEKINISSHGPCGMKTRCESCVEDATNHDYNQISKKIRELLS